MLQQSLNYWMCQKQETEARKTHKQLRSNEIHVNVKIICAFKSGERKKKRTAKCTGEIPLSLTWSLGQVLYLKNELHRKKPNHREIKGVLIHLFKFTTPISVG